ncbi:hypothetical protein ACHHYP_12792 [Achlya hypogyna]|uniref:Elicitin n=1 Tax=Achlya hypogyna TaxID=1202772 RepID=A0A1V9YGJ5_ACHHY|nr:hypothetical protein ACHHYP_12792 [Achlya hypogyna]
MKSTKLILAGLVAVAQADDAPQCDLAALTGSFLSVIGTASQCQVAANYTFMPPKASPTAADVEAICAAPACQGLIPLLSNIPACYVGPVDLGAFAVAVKARCGNSTGNSSGNSNTTATTAPVTAKPGVASTPSVVAGVLAAFVCMLVL